jgi:dTDP-glucose 4,6-dehydratase
MINLLEFARQSNPKMQFIHISTDEVYGALPFGETNSEWERIYAPSNPYSASKAAQETLAIAYFKTYQLPIAIINSTNMIGEAQNVEKFLPKAIFLLMHNLAVHVDTDNSGKIGSRKYVDVIDVARAVWMASLELQKPRGETELPLKYHVAGSRDVSNHELIDMIGKVLKQTPNVIIRPSPRPGYDLRYELSTDLIRNLGWAQEFLIEDRISEVVNWTINNPEWLLIDHAAN